MTGSWARDEHGAPVWDEHGAEAQCGACGAVNVVLFYLPGAGWGFQYPHLGLCQPCGQGNEQYQERFREHFGDIKLVSDTDQGQSGEAA